MTMKKLTLLFAIIMCAALLGWLLRYRMIYHYDVWRMEHAVEDGERNTYNEKIQALSHKASKSGFINTYCDTNNKNIVRRAAAMALIKADPRKAENLFGKYIDSANSDVSGMAIRDLGTIKSKTFKNEILHKRNSANEIIRWSVVDYFGNFDDAESRSILKSIKDSDKSEMVRYHAAEKLKHL
jgi:HEAT repeat protein